MMGAAVELSVRLGRTPRRSGDTVIIRGGAAAAARAQKEPAPLNN